MYVGLKPSQMEKFLKRTFIFIMFSNEEEYVGDILIEKCVVRFIPSTCPPFIEVLSQNKTGAISLIHLAIIVLRDKAGVKVSDRMCLVASRFQRISYGSYSVWFHSSDIEKSFSLE